MNETSSRLVVNLNERSYPIYIGEDLLLEGSWHNYIPGQQVCIVTNATLAPLYLSELKNSLKEFVCDEIILPDGESYKTLDSLSTIFDCLIKKQHRRNTTLLALGGGVIGDITGFAAASYQRGVHFIQLPTSLLAQVDASVGGKTAINHPLGKNMIGAFYQPKAVVIDINTLQTLPDREFNSGIAEIVKAALIADEDLFCWLETNMKKMLDKEPMALLYAIKQAIAIKIRIVVADERENNIRAYLNLGHTFAHGIEQLFGYGTYLHGEAVAMGLVLAADLSTRLGWLDPSILLRIKNILTMAKLPIRLPSSLSAERLLESMSTDKKKHSPDLKLILLKGIGQVAVSSLIDEQLIVATIKDNTV